MKVKHTFRVDLDDHGGLIATPIYMIATDRDHVERKLRRRFGPVPFDVHKIQRVRSTLEA